MGIKLAQALLRRKELAEKIHLAGQIKNNSIYETRVQRVKVTDSVDEVTANMCKLTLDEVMREYNYYAKQLRLIDAAIQQCNWTSELPDLGDDVMSDFGSEEK